MRTWIVLESRFPAPYLKIWLGFLTLYRRVPAPGSRKPPLTRGSAFSAGSAGSEARAASRFAGAPFAPGGGLQRPVDGLGIEVPRGDLAVPHLRTRGNVVDQNGQRQILLVERPDVAGMVSDVRIAAHRYAALNRQRLEIGRGPALRRRKLPDRGWGGRGVGAGPH